MKSPKARRTVQRSLLDRLQRTCAPLMSVATAAVMLRVFLGGTMLYAGVDKTILDPRFLQPDGVGSIGETLRLFVTADGPLASLVNAVAVEQPVLIGAAMAGTQVLVGALLLSGSWVRLGALLGAAISLSLALTASWGVSPYYYGNDLPYFVAFLALAAIGDGGVLRAGAPVTRGHDPQRRAALFTGGGALLALLALVALDRSRLTGLFAPNSGSNTSPTPGATATPSPSGAASGSPEPTPSPTASEAPAGSASPNPSATGGKTPQPSPSATAGGGSVGTVIAGGSSLSSGQALNFSAGSTAAVLLKDGSTYRAFERACTHQGTNVDWEPANGSFYCSNHGARFSSTGDAIVGPARTPLRPIAVSVAADGSVSYTR
ncbi:MAG: TQO small subunit DoxD [Candidatus Limnocylindrus sp.]